jgi:hypothetical protein
MTRAFYCWWLMVALVGCGPDEESGRVIDFGEAAGSSCALDNLTQPCSCGGASMGQRTCRDGAFTACRCQAANGGSQAAPGEPIAGDPPANRSGVRFDWERTMPTGGSCEAGHYEGTFTGWYGPSIIVVADLKVIPVFPVALPGNPGLAFDLFRTGEGEVFNVENGKLNGNALGAFPLTADIVGKLDCETLKFDARLVNGSYFIGPLEYKFEGPITADYNMQTHSMVGGKWSVAEPAYPSAGGMGDWTVTWIRN